jgi:hypothetical protein
MRRKDRSEKSEQQQKDGINKKLSPMSNLACNTVEEVEQLQDSQYLSIAASRSGSALQAVPKISKNLVAYMAALVAVSPYKHGPFDFSCQGCCGACISGGDEEPKQAQERALHGLPQAQARRMVPRARHPRPLRNSFGRRGGAHGTREAAPAGSTAGEAEAEEGGDAGDGGAAMGFTLD